MRVAGMEMAVAHVVNQRVGSHFMNHRKKTANNGLHNTPKPHREHNRFCFAVAEQSILFHLEQQVRSFTPLRLQTLMLTDIETLSYVEHFIGC